MKQRMMFLLVALVLVAGAAQADVHWNGLYHNNTNLDAETEMVPAVVNPGETNYFLEVNYPDETATVYWLTDHPAADGAVSCRVLFSTDVDEEEWAQWVANIVISNEVPFHNTPAAGSVTVEVWRAVWRPPAPFTGTVYYSPQVLDDGGADIQSLVRHIGTNGLPDWGVNDFFWQTNAQLIGGADVTIGEYSFEWTNAIPQNYDWFYFNNTNTGLPEAETVPGLGDTNFFEYSYDPDVPGYVYTLAPKGGLASARTRFWFDGEPGKRPGEIIRDAAWYMNVEIDSGAPFHGLPISGTVTMDVWRTPFYAPDGWGTGGADTVYYATELTVPKNGTMWMTRHLNVDEGTDAVTNNWTTNPQLFVEDAPADGRDWIYTPTAAMDRAESLERDWAYHNNTNYDAELELVPGMGVTHFVDVDYAGTVTTFRVMLDNPTIAKVPGESVEVSMRVWTGEKGEEWLSGSWNANVTLDSASPFHGLPAAGTKTLDLWTAQWMHPTNASGPVTNQFDVYYAFLLKTVAGSLSYQTDYTYLVGKEDTGAGWGLNNYTMYPQVYAPDYTDHDYKYVHEWLDTGDIDGDGMPNWWEEKYSGDISNLVASAHGDGDTNPNGDEYIADTDPLVTGSAFSNVIETVTYSNDTDTFSVWVGPWTSTRRLYDLWWKSNLMDTTWMPIGLDVPGNYDGSAVILTIDGIPPKAAIRSGVKLP